MSGNDDEQFDLTPQIDEPMNAFKVVHLYNKSQTYHLTRQVLLDSVLTQNTYCFFYHILAKTVDEFNQIYGSFACLIETPTASIADPTIEFTVSYSPTSGAKTRLIRSECDPSDGVDKSPLSKVEANLYLNVDSEALDHIIKYIQTTKINGEMIYNDNWKTIDEIIDLATMFGMPKLVTMLRGLHPSEETINDAMTTIKYYLKTLLSLYKKHIKVNYDIDKYCTIFSDFLEENKQSITDSYIKTNLYKNELLISKFLISFIELHTDDDNVAAIDNKVDDIVNDTD